MPRGYSLRLRVLLITHMLANDDRGGAEAYVDDLAAALQETDEVCVLAGYVPRGHSFPVRVIDRLSPLPPAASTPRKALWHAREQWSLAQHRRIRRELARFSPDVVHTHECQGLTAAVFSAIRAEGLPHVHTTHDSNLLCMNTRMLRNGRPCEQRCTACLLQRSIRSTLAASRLDMLLAPSDRLRQLHVAAGVVPPDRARTVRQGAVPDHPRRRGAHNGALRVGFIGALSEHKGVLTVLAAAAGSRGDWGLDIAGSGPLGEHVSRVSRADPRITYHGPVDGASKNAFFAELDLVVVPSEGEENAPLVVAEACVRGIPVVVSDRGGLPETFLATVVPASDARALAAVIDAFDGDRARLTAISESLLARTEEFSWEHHVRQVRGVLGAVQTMDEPPRSGFAPARLALRAALVRRGSLG